VTLDEAPGLQRLVLQLPLIPAKAVIGAWLPVALNNRPAGKA
jgi:hypothetical protein